MTIDDDELMAFVDGQLEAGRVVAVQRAIAEDPVLAERVRQAHSLRERLRQAFEPVLHEPVPPRLSALVAPERAKVRRRMQVGTSSLWVGGLGLAAGVLVGLVIATAGGRSTPSTSQEIARGAVPVAGSILSEELTHQLASSPPAGGSVRVGISIRRADGTYCRTFVTSEGPDSVAGLACRESKVWRIRALQAVEGSTSGPDAFRQASTALPPAVVEAVENAIVGQPLDAEGESKARAADWMPAASPR